MTQINQSQPLPQACIFCALEIEHTLEECDEEVLADMARAVAIIEEARNLMEKQTVSRDEQGAYHVSGKLVQFDPFFERYFCTCGDEPDGSGGDMRDTCEHAQAVGAYVAMQNLHGDAPTTAQMDEMAAYYGEAELLDDDAPDYVQERINEMIA